MNTVQVSDVALDRPPGGFLDTWAWTFLGPQLFGIDQNEKIWSLQIAFVLLLYFLRDKELETAKQVTAN